MHLAISGQNNQNHPIEISNRKEESRGKARSVGKVEVWGCFVEEMEKNVG